MNKVFTIYKIELPEGDMWEMQIQIIPDAINILEKTLNNKNEYYQSLLLPYITP